MSPELASGHRTFDRLNGLVVSAQCGADPANRQVGVFEAGECQPTITTADGKQFRVRDRQSACRVVHPPRTLTGRGFETDLRGRAAP